MRLYYFTFWMIRYMNTLFRPIHRVHLYTKHHHILPFTRLLSFVTSSDIIPEKQDYVSRKSWSVEDTEKLISLVEKYGNKWKVFTYYFPNRTAECIRSRYLCVKYDTTKWTLEEKKILQQYFRTLKDHDNINWEEVQSLLPSKRTIARIKQFYSNTIQPNIIKGNWTEEETDKLKELIKQYGTDNWETIAKHLSTRSEDQCRNKWAYEIKTLKKGDFTKEEDEALISYVNKYGLEQLYTIKQEMNSQRSVCQLRSRYTNVLDPSIDRSTWTEEEKAEVVRLYQELKNIREVKAKMNSKRSIRDIYNHLRKKRQ